MHTVADASKTAARVRDASFPVDILNFSIFVKSGVPIGDIYQNKSTTHGDQ